MSECCAIGNIWQISIVSSASSISALCCLFGQLCVCSEDGSLKQLDWSTGLQVKNQSRRVSDIPFAYDLHPARAIPLMGDIFIRSVVIAESLGGVLVILSDGRTGIIISETESVFDFNQVQGVFAPNVTNATAVCFNRRFRQISVCCANGSIATFFINELTNELFPINKFTMDGGFNSSGQSFQMIIHRKVAQQSMRPRSSIQYFCFSKFISGKKYVLKKILL
jgi:hypothetical protein